MTMITVSTWIAVPPERAFALASDTTQTTGLFHDLARLESLTPGPFGVGTRWRVTRAQGKREVTEEVQVSQCDRPRGFTLVGESGGVPCTRIFYFEPDRGGTIVSIDFEAAAQSWLARWLASFGPLAKKRVHRRLQQDLADLKHAAEASAPSAGAP